MSGRDRKVNLTYEGPLNANEITLLRRAMTLLNFHYPGFPWGAEVDKAMLTIRNKMLGTWGYRINLLLHTEESLDHEIVMSGGECLERFRQPRAKADIDRLEEQPKDARGFMVPDK